MEDAILLHRACHPPQGWPHLYGACEVTLRRMLFCRASVEDLSSLSFCLREHCSPSSLARKVKTQQARKSEVGEPWEPDVWLRCFWVLVDGAAAAPDSVQPEIAYLSHHLLLFHCKGEEKRDLAPQASHHLLSPLEERQTNNVSDSLCKICL